MPLADGQSARLMGLQPAQRLVRVLRWCAAALAVHGLVLWLFAALKPFFPETPEVVAEALFRILAVPAFVLASPFTSLFWTVGLMNAPGWFAWPKPLGFLLAYTIWVGVLLGLAEVVRWWSRK